MAHVLTQIRDAIESNLGSMATVPAASVFVDRIYPLERQDFPCVLLSVMSETADPGSFGNGITYDRSASVDVHVCVLNNTAFDTAANQIQLEVEKAIAADPTVGGIATSIRYTGRSKSMNGDGETPFVSVTLSYQVTYRTDSTAPDVAV